MGELGASRPRPEDTTGAGTRRTGAPDTPTERASARLGAYLRRLREGYGYTLRKVEEKSVLLGEPIDNSQLSRFEKGKALPSFDKLRALARIFNVPVQNFSDVLDLEEFEGLKPSTSVYDEALQGGVDAYSRGEFGRAFVTFERALEIAEDEGDAAERVVEARWRMAAALKSLGKLSMTERELREILKTRAGVSRRTRLRALLHLSYVYRDLADVYVAQVLARESLDLAVEEGDLDVQAAVLNTLGNIHEPDEPERANGYYERAYQILTEMNAPEERRLTVLVNLGGCLVRLHRFEDGVVRLQEAQRRARERGYRRVGALATTRMAEALLQRGRIERAIAAFEESDAIASDPREPYHDILFLNAFHRWTVSRQERSTTREKIEFGRLRRLRALLERRFPEVETFDRHVERIRRNQS